MHVVSSFHECQIDLRHPWYIFISLVVLQPPRESHFNTYPIVLLCMGMFSNHLFSGGLSRFGHCMV